MTPVLEVANLHVTFGGRVAAVRGVSLTVNRGETHCLVGESGCGKSVTALAVMNLLVRSADRRADVLRFHDHDLTRLSERGMARLRGDKVAMIFQEPMTSLNPAYTIGSQMAEVLRRHRRVSRRQAMDRAAELLGRVGITAPGMRLGQHPHQLSGGLRQRVMIAMALMCEPELLIADEPTTALDVTVQAQILRLLQTLQRELGLALLLITHDLGIVARMAQRVSVMYAGEVVETAPVEALFAAPTHPYTRGLLACIPVPGGRSRDTPLGSIPGVVPRIAPGYAGCAFRDRCAHATEQCAHQILPRDAGSSREADQRRMRVTGSARSTLNRDTLSRDALSRDTLNRDTLSRDTLTPGTLDRDTLNRDTLDRDAPNRDTRNRDILTPDTVTLPSPAERGTGVPHTYLCRLPPGWPSAEAA